MNEIWIVQMWDWMNELTGDWEAVGAFTTKEAAVEYIKPLDTEYRDFQIWPCRILE
jgi:hypothetical protein